MSKTTVREYTFNPASKTITLLNLSEQLKLEQVLWITNVTRNIVLYNAIDASARGSITNNVITLNYDTTSMDSGDALQIYIDSAVADQTYLTDLLEAGLAEIVHQLQVIRNDGGMADTSGRMRVAIESSTNTQAISISANQDIRNITGAIAGLTAIGTHQATQFMVSGMNSAAQNLRSKIIVS